MIVTGAWRWSEVSYIGFSMFKNFNDIGLSNIDIEVRCWSEVIDIGDMGFNSHSHEKETTSLGVHVEENANDYD
ncbi:uncharacterized protein G2W53_036962 [Senna tora]|uniref:Uncharacterized protein n=1 Tax=Senna tora TaxID=362788 RepID=A0A834SUM0_9FABA|nr:uncharacterized protein G2W53_036962 [Senna tora]